MVNYESIMGWRDYLVSPMLNSLESFYQVAQLSIL